MRGVISPFPHTYSFSIGATLSLLTGFITYTSVNSRNTAARNGNGMGQIKLRMQFPYLLC
jgi:hypothetical protein